jgi:hypothetical protein
MAARARLAIGEHNARADRHAKVGDALHGAGDEWAAVCFFYAAYHLVRATLLSDPIFSDMSRLKVINRNLMPQDQFSESHHGSRQPGASFGVNELVRLLYPSIYRHYEYLHQASIQVRYEKGLRFQLDSVRESLDAVRGAVEAGLTA